MNIFYTNFSRFTVLLILTTTAIWRFAIIIHAVISLTPADTYVSLCVSIPGTPSLKNCSDRGTSTRITDALVHYCALVT